MIKLILYKLLKEYKINIDEDLFFYGWAHLKQYTIYFITTFPIICYYKTFQISVLFLLLYIPLRRYLGGFHFNRNITCLLTSSFITIICPIIADRYTIHFFITSIIFILLIISTYLAAPIEHSNKKLTFYEKKLYKKKALYIELLYFVFCLISIILSKPIYINLISIIFLISLINIILTYIININYVIFH